MNLDEATNQINQKIAQSPGLNARVKFNFGDDGIVFVDTTQNPPVVNHDDADADVTLTCALATFAGFLNGSQDPNIAFMMGKLKVAGSMGLALKLNALLEG